MLTIDDITGLIASAAGGAVLGYFVSSMRHHWQHRPYHIVWDDDGIARIIRNRR